jgi:hypothetical protein
MVGQGEILVAIEFFTIKNFVGHRFCVVVRVRPVGGIVVSSSHFGWTMADSRALL